jgi:hypothetical protein
LAVVENMPESWVLGKSDSGWMKVNVFYEYIANDFNNWMIENSIKKTGHPFHRWTQVTYDFAIKRILRKESNNFVRSSTKHDPYVTACRCECI